MVGELAGISNKLNPYYNSSMTREHNLFAYALHGHYIGFTSPFDCENTCWPGVEEWGYCEEWRWDCLPDARFYYPPRDMDTTTCVDLFMNGQFHYNSGRKQWVRQMH